MPAVVRDDLIFVHIPKYETLESDFRVIQDKLQKWESLPHCNKSEHDEYQKYFTTETKDFVAKMFGYTF